jgi:hypothetical protein
MNSNHRIVVLQRGWVAVGELDRSAAPQLKLENASIIRRWGTTKGLGELAAEGPRGQTVLDPAGTLEFHELAVVTTFVTDPSKWTQKLSAAA